MGYIMLSVCIPFPSRIIEYVSEIGNPSSWVEVDFLNCNSFTEIDCLKRKIDLTNKHTTVNRSIPCVVNRIQNDPRLPCEGAHSKCCVLNPVTILHLSA